jgi:N6-adenosine-specific RNA methylase IME4
MIVELTPHPLAELLPPMSEADYLALRESIRCNGQREPITLHRDGRIIDGRHRARACAELGIEPVCRIFEGADSEILAFVLDLNLKRRHLDESQRAMIAAKLANLGEGRPSLTASIEAVSQANAATMFNVSRSAVQRAAKVYEGAIPDIVAAVEEGRLAVSLAAHAADLPASRQRSITENLGNGRSPATLVLAATRMERVAAIERASVLQPLSALGRTFPVIYADPPWRQTAWSEGGQLKAPEMHYPTMPLADICALPVQERVAARDCVLFMWALPNMLPPAFDVVRAWGFNADTATSAVWVKPHIACGKRFRGQHEPIICATRGSMPPPPDLHSSVFYGPPAEPRFGSKPNVVRDWIKAAYPAAGRIELFARTPSPDWVSWGYEAVNEAAE